MDEVKISRKIQALTLELEKKEKKLMRLNKRNEIRKSLGKVVGNSPCINGVVTTSYGKGLISGSLDSPQPQAKQQEISDHANSVFASDRITPIAGNLHSEHGKRNENELCKGEISKAPSAYGTQDLPKYDITRKGKISEKDEHFQNHEEELFPDENVEPSDVDDNVCALPDGETRVLNAPNFQNHINEESCDILEQNKTDSLITHPSTDFDNEQSDEMNSRRKSTRLSSRTTRNRYSSNKVQLDIKSIIDVAFDILCEMGKNSKQEDFTLSGREFDELKFKRIEKKVCCETEGVDNKEVNIPDFTCSDNIVPPTFMHVPCKDHDKHHDDCNSDVVSDEPHKVKTPLASELRPFLKAESTLVSAHENKEMNLIDHSKHSSKVVKHIGSLSPKNTSSQVEGGDKSDEENKQCVGGVKSEKANKLCNDVITNKENSDIRNQSFRANENCNKHDTKNVLTDMEIVLHANISEKEDDAVKTSRKIQKESPVKSEVKPSCKIVQVLQSAETGSVECLFLVERNGSFLMWMRLKKSICLWKELESSWAHCGTYVVPEEEEVLDCTVFGCNLAVLCKESGCFIRILSSINLEICVQGQVSLGQLSRAAVSGSVSSIQDGLSVSSCLQFESQCSQIEIHTVRPSQPASTTYLEPASENVLCPVVSVHGLPSALMGLGANKLFFWNTTSGLLVRTVSLHSSEGPNHTIKKCIWAKVEKGLLFGVFKSEESGDWKLYVINPTTGLYHELCCYACPTCSENKSNKYTVQRPLYGRVECHKLLSICTKCHLTVFELLSAKALLVSKADDIGAATLFAMDLVVASLNGSVCMYKIDCNT